MTEETKKYEIVSRLRGYKHQIIELSAADFDVLLPQIKDYIFSKDNEALKNEFEKKLNQFKEIVDSAEYKAWKNSLFTEYYGEMSEGYKAELAFYIGVSGNENENDFLNAPNIKDEDINTSTEYFNGVLYSITEGIARKFKRNNENFNSRLAKAQLNGVFNNSIDFYFMNSDDFTPFYLKEINNLKFATIEVLSHLESVVLNSVDKVEEIKKSNSPSSICIQKYNFKPIEIEIMYLRDTLPTNTYIEIAKCLSEKKSVSGITQIVTAIKNKTSTNSIDKAISKLKLNYEADILSHLIENS